VKKRHLLSNCIFYCNDYSSLLSTTAVQIRIISYILHIVSCEQNSNSNKYDYYYNHTDCMLGNTNLQCESGFSGLRAGHGDLRC